MCEGSDRMDHAEALKHMMQERGMNAQTLGKTLGYKSPSNVNKALSHSPRLSTFIKMAEILGYTVVIQPTHKKLLKDQIPISSADE